EQAASQENVDPLNDASISDMEVRIQRLESELSEVKMSQDSFKIELEEFKRLFLEELKLTTSLENKLNNTNDMLAEMRTQLLMKSPRDTSLSTAPSRPVLMPPCIGRLNDWLLPRGNLAPREQLVIRTSTPQTSNKGTLTNLLKEQQELVESITRDVQEDPLYQSPSSAGDVPPSGSENPRWAVPVLLC
ncbi:ankyrin repeat domain-containing protein 26-like, partial [Rhinolophus ferrumequinum]|uniref:ankyrin repeat domain-containing protein 26-like n=1 Tax=Rhinolophus ferrumequinum TaxID=59479 RepID=UPI00140FB486